MAGRSELHWGGRPAGEAALLLTRRAAPSRAQLLEEGQRVHVAFTGEFGPHTTSPRQLTSEVRRALAPHLAACLCSHGSPMLLLVRERCGGGGREMEGAACSLPYTCRRCPNALFLAPLPPSPSPHPSPWPQFLSKLVNLQGIVTRCTLVRPKIVKSVHW